MTSTVVNGASTIVTLDGSETKKLPNTLYIAAKDINLINTKKGLSPEQAIIAEGLYSAAFAGLVKTNETGPRKIEWEDRRPLADVDDVYVKVLKNDGLKNLNNINNDLNKQKEKRNKQKRNSDKLKKNAERVFDSLFKEGTEQLLNLAKEQINKLLPAEFQFNASVSYDSEGNISFQGLSVGDITYNSEDNTISYGDFVYNSLAKEGLDLVNEQLPDFLRVNLSQDALGLGNAKIDLDTLYDNPEQKFPLNSSVSAQAVGDEILVYLGDAIYQVGTRNSTINKGLESLNKLLPTGMKTTVQFPAEQGLPKIGVGPINVDLSTGDLALDGSAVNNLLTSKLESVVFNQLPAPLSAIGRAAWRSLNLSKLLSFNTKREVKPNDSLVVNGLTTSTQSLTPAFNV